MTKLATQKNIINSRIEDLVRLSSVYNLVDSSIAIIDKDGQILFENTAFKKLNASFICQINKVNLPSLIINTQSIQDGIRKCAKNNSNQLIKETYHYSKKIAVTISILLRPIWSAEANHAEGVFLTIAEENIEHENHHLARAQNTEKELCDRILLLTKEQIDKDKLINALLKETPFGIMLLDSKRNVIQINKACEDILHITSREAMGHTCDQFLYCYKKENKCPLLDNNETIHAQETDCINADKSLTPVLRSTVVLNHSNEPVIIETFIDIAERKKSDVKMKKLSRALEQTADSVIITDTSGIIEYVNKAFEHTTGFNQDEALGSTPKLIKSNVHDKIFYKKMWSTILAGDIYREVITNRKKDGTLFHEEKTITPLRNEKDEITHFISTGKDITERIATHEKLQFLAYHDVLTGLPNRALFSDRLEHALARSKRQNKIMAVLFLDLDRFKSINDTLGHATGDEVLNIVALRLKSCLRDGDTVARFGGDEFAVLLEDIKLVDDINPIVKKILFTFEQPISIEQRELFITTTVGISIYPTDTEEPQVLMKNADIAMYRAKEKGRNTYQFYSQDMGIKAFEHMVLESSLRQALGKDEFQLYYQPQIDIASKKIVGVEALIRWNHADLGLVLPNDFIPVLEETGLIIPVGIWVLETACRELTLLHEINNKNICMSINMSSKQFGDPEIPDLVSQTLKQYNLDPSHLEIEITESVLLVSSKIIKTNFRKLEKIGVRLAIDDFGTGYSSLSYLKRFPITTLKIDRSFIKDVTVDKNDAAIVQAIIAMALSLDLRIIAEGVETADQLAFIHKYKCDIAQGYYFSRPVSMEDLMKKYKE